jgi:hypothetical protein
VVNGFSDENPVTLEDRPSKEGDVRVEKSIAPEDARDQLDAEGSETKGAGSADADKPAAKSSGKSGKRK